MAITSISRIQQRRGKKHSDTGLPQLASGELAWCIDSQELYIGNGAVSEGAPAVGNTKILTALDIAAQGDLLSLFQRTYKIGSSVITGSASNFPVYRSIQSVLDDRVTTKEFGVVGDGITDDTIAFQRAIDQLFLNPAGVAHSTVDARITLIIPAGNFKITNTIYIPSYAKIVGAGAEKTIIMHSGTSSVFRFVNALSTIGNPAGMGNTLIDSNLDGNFTNDPTDVSYNNQPQYIEIDGMTIFTSSSTQVALQLEAVRNSIFSNLNIKGSWNGTYNANSIGIKLYAFTSIVTCERNIFRNIDISGFSYAVYSKQDIINNVFECGYIQDVRQGFSFGVSADGVSIGEQYGPRNNHIKNITFYNIKQHAVLINFGSGNITNDIIFKNVGNNGGGNSTPQYPQLYFNTLGNASVNTTSDRSNALTLPNLITPYISEMSGRGEFDLMGSQKLSIGQYSTFHSLFRLPVACSSTGLPSGTVNYVMNYVYKSTSGYSRAGVINILVDVEAADAKITDDYSFVGANAQVNSLALVFHVTLLDYVGALYTGTSGQLPYTISVSYTNTLAGDSGYFDYTYTTFS